LASSSKEKEDGDAKEDLSEGRSSPAKLEDEEGEDELDEEEEEQEGQAAFKLYVAVIPC
jgi:hypothetical protein